MQGNQSGGVAPQNLNIGNRLDRIPATRVYWFFVMLFGLYMIFMVGDLLNIGFAMPGIEKNWHLPTSDISLLISSSAVGSAVGAFVGGTVSDLLGRKRAVLVWGIFFSACSLLTVFVTNIGELTALRVLTGLGGVAATVAVVAYMGEVFPASARGRLTAVAFAINGMGAGLSALIADISIPAFDSGWRLIFLWGALGFIPIGILWKLLPESPRWLEAKGRLVEADTQVATLEKRVSAIVGPLPSPSPWVQSIEENKYPLGAILKGMYLKRVLVGIVISFVGTMVFYGYQSFIPTLLVDRGFTVVHSLGYTTITEFGGTFGGLVVWLVADRWPRWVQLVLSAVVASALLLVYGLTSSVPVILVSGFLTVLLLQVFTPVTYLYFAEIFPNRARGTGVGFINLIGHGGPIVGPFIIGFIVSHYAPSAVFWFLAISYTALVGVWTWLFGEKKTTGRSVEEINEAKEDSPAVAGVEATPTL